ncbi:hypothetical protein niasHS_014066 [Heterodera schachtii]|uniref:Uncharacterized protein n=1 Tax=Heterodera schachtii TaxID=97005 RepID=A0ABD2II01_HETSC
MTNIGELLQAGGSYFKHVVFAKILLADMSDFQAVNETFKSYFTPDTYPARSLCQVVKMPKNGRVKIDVVAIAPNLGAGFGREAVRAGDSYPLKKCAQMNNKWTYVYCILT